MFQIDGRILRPCVSLLKAQNLVKWMDILLISNVTDFWLFTLLPAIGFPESIHGRERGLNNSNDVAIILGLRRLRLGLSPLLKALGLQVSSSPDSRYEYQHHAFWAT